MTRQDPKIRVAIVGCGQIADAHLSQLARIPWAQVVAVCDLYEDLAYQAAARFNVPRYETSLDRMVEETRPDVVHVTTPAHTHAPLAKQLLNARCHVYVEKPFTLDAVESREVIDFAEHQNLKVCVGHDQLFDPLWLRAKQWIEQSLIGEVRHIESVLGYPIDGKFGALVAANPRHWVRQLPGGLFQNTISHPLYRILDLLTDESPQISGNWFTRPEFDFPTEMHISLHGSRQTGTLTFSTVLPPQRITRIYGSKGTLDLDFDAQTIRYTAQPRLPGAFAKLEAPWLQFKNSCWNLKTNLLRFVRSDIHYFAGMKTLFERFYLSILDNQPMPIPHAETHRVTALMDDIFAHCAQNASTADPLTHGVRTAAQETSAKHLEVSACP